MEWVTSLQRRNCFYLPIIVHTFLSGTTSMDKCSSQSCPLFRVPLKLLHHSWVFLVIYCYVLPSISLSLSAPGQLGGSEETDCPSEDIQTSLEVGLLGHVRKVLMLMPDSLAHLVVGEVVRHFSLVAMVHNKDIVVRTAAIRVSVHHNTH